MFHGISKSMPGTAGTIIHQYHYSEALSSKLNWLACLKLDLTIILISQPRGELIC